MTKGILAASDLGEFAAAAAGMPPVADETALARATAAFSDTIACIIAAWDDPATRAVRKTACRTGPGRCSVVGLAETLDAEQAAMVNGTAAHALDFDDNFLPAVTHASAVLVPALLALGEEAGSTGAALLDAYVIGLEVQAWLGRRMIPDHYAAGWHATSTIGAIGAAAACARLMQLKATGFLNALSIACSLAGGSKLQFGTMAKPLHAGLAARAGMLAARLAEDGLEANPDPVSGDWGFAHLHHGRADASPAAGDLAIVTDGLAQKRFPCCASAHRSLDAIVALGAAHGFAAQDIEAIETVVPASNYRNLRFDHPVNEKEARFSMTYCAAVVALRGRLDLADFRPEAVHRGDVAEMMNRVTMRPASADPAAGGGIWDQPAETLIRLKDGRRLTQSVRQPVGTISAPLAHADLDLKIDDCTRGRLSAAGRRALRETLGTFATAPASAVTRFLRAASR